MVDDRPALKQREITLLQRWNLAVGLTLAVPGFLLLPLTQIANIVVFAHFLQCPTHTKVADLSLGEVGDPIEGCDDHRHVVLS